MSDKKIENVGGFFRLKTENEAIKDKLMKENRNCCYLDNKEEEYLQTSKRPNEEYLNKIKPYLNDIINDVQISGLYKIQLTIAINN